VFLVLADILKIIGSELISSEEANEQGIYNAQVMFESLILEDFSQILIEFNNKQNILT